MVHVAGLREGDPESFGFEDEKGTDLRRQPQPSLSGLRALVVEDDPDNLEVLVCLLEEEGVVLKGVGSASAARAVLEAGWMPDVLLVDLTLPDEDGCTLLQSLRAGLIDPAIPAIAMTGHTDVQARGRVKQAGFQLHLAKPYEINDVLGALAPFAPAAPQTP
jgi:CheY-like chemotaxis protein